MAGQGRRFRQDLQDEQDCCSRFRLNRLLIEKEIKSSKTRTKMFAGNYFPDIIGIYLEYALDECDWEGWKQMSNDGITVTGFWDKNKGGPDPNEYLNLLPQTTLSKR